MFFVEPKNLATLEPDCCLDFLHTYARPAQPKRSQNQRVGFRFKSEMFYIGCRLNRLEKDASYTKKV